MQISLPYVYQTPQDGDSRFVDQQNPKLLSYEQFCECVVGHKLEIICNDYWFRYTAYLLKLIPFLEIDCQAIESDNRKIPPKILISLKEYRTTGEFPYIPDNPYQLYYFHEGKYLRTKLQPEANCNWLIKYHEIYDPIKRSAVEIHSLNEAHSSAFTSSRDLLECNRNHILPNISNGSIMYDGQSIKTYRVKDISSANDFFFHVKKTKKDYIKIVTDTLSIIPGTGVLPRHIPESYLAYDWSEEDVKKLKSMLLFLSTIRTSLADDLYLWSDTIKTSLSSHYPGLRELPKVEKSIPIPDIILPPTVEYDMNEPDTYTSDKVISYVDKYYHRRVEQIRLLVSAFRFPKDTKFLLYGDGAGTAYSVMHTKYIVESYDPSLKMLDEARKRGNVVKEGGIELIEDDAYKDYIIFISHVMNVDTRLHPLILKRGKAILYESVKFEGFTSYNMISDSLYATKDIAVNLFGSVLPVRSRRPPASFHDFSKLVRSDRLIIGIDVKHSEYLLKSWFEQGIRATISSVYQPLRYGFFQELAEYYGHRIVKVVPNVVMTDHFVPGYRNLNVVKGWDTHRATLITDKLSFYGAFSTICSSTVSDLKSPVFWRVTHDKVILPIKGPLNGIHRHKIGSIIYLPPGRYQISGCQASILTIH